MSQLKPFQRSGVRQYPLVAEALIDYFDLLYGGPLITSATAKPGVIEVNDINALAIAGASGSSLYVASTMFNLFELPAGAIVIGGEARVLTAWVGPTALTINIGSDQSGQSAVYTASAIDLKAAAGTRTALTVRGTQLQVTEKTTMTIATYTAGTTPTAGQLHVYLQYMLPGRGHETQGV